VVKIKFELTKREAILAVAFGLMGFLLSSQPTIMFLHSLSPIKGLLLKYIIIFSALYVLSHYNLIIIGKAKMDRLAQIIGCTLITFAFFITISWSSCLIQYTTVGKCEISPVYLQSEDGAVWYIYERLLPKASMESLRILTYVVTPGVLALIGGYLTETKVEFSPVMELEEEKSVI